jgi:hypothetical protein
MKQPSATRQKYDELIEEGTLIVHDSAILDWEEIF